MLRKALFVVLAVIVLALPFAVRWFYYHEARYNPGKVARPNLSEIRVPSPEVGSFVDRHTAADPGTVLVDLAHGNRLEMAELSVLQARLTARGQRLEPVEESDSLAKQLSEAKALIVVSPSEDWRTGEIELVRKFVDKGGRLLLVADPTRFTIKYDDQESAILDDDSSHINELAVPFGLLFQADYLYNTTDNAGNYRNIKLTDFAEHRLTRGLDEVAFYAAHSLTSESLALISAGGETRSSASERADRLAVAVLTAEEAVLALGDLTFMVEPYNAAYDNDRLIANIADFLSGVRRGYELADFPFFFDEQVDLVFAGDPLLDSNLLQAGSTLQSLLASEGKRLTIREAESRTADTLFVGLYDEASEVQPYLANADIALLISPTASAEGEKQQPRARTTPSPAPNSSLTATSPTTSTLELTLTPPADLGSEPQAVVTAVISPTLTNQVQIESMGEMELDGTVLLFLQSDGERQVMVVLADTQTGLDNALERLAKGSLEGCLLRETETPSPTSLAFCTTGETAEGEEGAGVQRPEPKPKSPTPSPSPPVTATVAPITHTVEPTGTIGGSDKSILVIALDEGQGRYDDLTSADNYAAILEELYDVRVWSESDDAPLDPEQLLEHDLVIWTAGDHKDAFGELENALLLRIMMEEIPAIVSGAYIGDVSSESVQRDVQVRDATHPIARGFRTGEVIAFVPPPSGSVYETSLLEDMGGQDEVIVLVRGPDSDDSGAPSLFTIADVSVGVQVAFIGFPLYLLPEEARTRLVLNTVGWMLGP